MKNILNSLKGDFLTFILRVVLLYLMYALCRILFYVYNSSLIGTIEFSDIAGILQGSFIFDSVSVFYINMPFLILSLIPFRLRENRGYQKVLFYLFVVTNSLALLVNFADIFYYEFKMGRIASDDLVYTGESNSGDLLISFMRDYWYGFLLYVALIWIFIKGYRRIAYIPTPNMGVKGYRVGATVLLSISLVMSIFFIRGSNFSPATFPIAMSDATLFVKKPAYSSLILSNPFCLIRTLGKGVRYERYFDEQRAQEIFPTTNVVDKSVERAFVIDSSTNIVMILLESFGSAHIGVLNGEQTPYTPFLDSLIVEGLLMDNAFHNGIRSIDALPSIWGSIPTYKVQFMSLPQAVAPMKMLPMMVKEMGYTTSFMHGAVSESMGFVALSKLNGVDLTFSREEYEDERGEDDYDGTWGIWDDKFLDFSADKIIEMKKPLFTTIFTLSSHAPFIVPKEYENRVVEGVEPMDKTLSYSDMALRQFFEKLSKEPFFDNTLFVITADHSSKNIVPKFQDVPYSFSVPILFYKPNSNFRGRYSGVASHVDIMPTILGMMGYVRPFFGFGRDIFGDDKDKRFTINYFGGAFNIITDSTTYLFNEKEVISTVGVQIQEDEVLERAKAAIQQYYHHIENRDYLPSEK